MVRESNRLKQLDMMGALGAAILGAGVALLFQEWLLPYAVPAVLVGMAAHGWAMFAKRRLERQAQVLQPAWERVAYWICWAMLIGLLGYVAVQLFLLASKA